MVTGRPTGILSATALPRPFHHPSVACTEVDSKLNPTGLMKRAVAVKLTETCKFWAQKTVINGVKTPLIGVIALVTNL